MCLLNLHNSMAIDGTTFLEIVRPALKDGDAQSLAALVAARWQVNDLCSLLVSPNVDVRRVAAVVIGLVGDMSSAPCLLQALQDGDEQVNQMAEHGLWSIWFRSGSPHAAKPFREGVAMLGAEAYQRAVECFEEASRIDPNFGEAYNQCAIAHFFLGTWEPAIAACLKTIKCVPSHFGAICGMGHCYTQAGDLNRALECYRRALKINPRMPAITRACQRIEQRMRELNDSSGTYSFGSISV